VANALMFLFVGSIALFLGRKIGWWISRNFLYAIPFIPMFIACVLWSAVLAFFYRNLVLHYSPNLILKIIGYGAGTYTAIANYALFAGIPDPDGQRRDDAISNIGMVSFWIFSLIFVYGYNG
jgi:hypothetical protein